MRLRSAADHGDGLKGRMDAELRHDVLQVGSHGIDRYKEARRHFAPPGSSGQAVEDLTLSQGEPGGPELVIARVVMLVTQQGRYLACLRDG